MKEITNNLQNQLNKLVRNGYFQEAFRLILSSDNDVQKQNTSIRSLMFDIANDEENVCVYGFFCFLIHESETIIYHKIAASYLDYTWPYLWRA